ENASSQKAVTEQFITRFARYYTPVVVILAASLAVIPSLLVGEFTTWLYRALSFLVISCPCALVISVPLSFFGGIGGASKAGILIKGSNYLENLTQARTVVMDKTGTLTKGSFEVAEIVCVEGKEAGLLEYAAYAESYSNHPISKSLQRAYGKEIKKEEITSTEEKAGMGVVTDWKGIRVYAGNDKLMLWLEKNNMFSNKEEKDVLLGRNQDKNSFCVDREGTICHVAIEKETEVEYLGYIVIADQIKEDAKRAIVELKEAGIKRIVMLTGDAEKTANTVCNTLGIKEYHAELLPGDKVEITEKLLRETGEKSKLIFVGDGMNDAPVLARADIGIAMGGLGSDAAIEAADIVIMNDQPSKIVTAMKISRKTLKIVKQNIVFAIGIKVVVLLLAALGMASMWAAVFADVGVAFLAILNAMRAMKVE
ncbi:MAG: heavy metal translocating P-type ATPase, partial [Lachnospiraceae bacterium]|nr:heavy metal translocating P-type ATPase [Lachnospiraceae bacterium]